MIFYTYIIKTQKGNKMRRRIYKTETSKQRSVKALGSELTSRIGYKKTAKDI